MRGIRGVAHAGQEILLTPDNLERRRAHGDGPFDGRRGHVRPSRDAATAL
jgi:hypothetical protein